MVRNLYRARAVWNMMKIILSREVVDLRVSGFFFKSLVQVVLLFSSETLVVTPYMGRDLRGFRDEVALRMTRRLPRRKPGWKR